MQGILLLYCVDGIGSIRFRKEKNTTSVLRGVPLSGRERVLRVGRMNAQVYIFLAPVTFQQCKYIGVCLIQPKPSMPQDQSLSGDSVLQA